MYVFMYVWMYVCDVGSERVCTVCMFTVQYMYFSSCIYVVLMYVLYVFMYSFMYLYIYASEHSVASDINSINRRVCREIHSSQSH
jgi:hypothetical protein